MLMVDVMQLSSFGGHVHIIYLLDVKVKARLKDNVRLYLQCRRGP